MACPWLIGRFVDPAAEFLYVPWVEVAAVTEGFRLVYRDDHELLARASPIYDALYAYCAKEMGRGG